MRKRQTTRTARTALPALLAMAVGGVAGVGAGGCAADGVAQARRAAPPPASRLSRPTTSVASASPSARSSSQNADASAIQNQPIVVEHQARPTVHGLSRSNWTTTRFVVPAGRTTHYPLYVNFSRWPVRRPAVLNPQVSQRAQLEWALAGAEDDRTPQNLEEVGRELARTAGDVALFPVRLFLRPPWTHVTTP